MINLTFKHEAALVRSWSSLAFVLALLAGSAFAQPAIQIRAVGEGIETSWADPGAVLQQSDGPSGPWNFVLEATSPHQILPTSSARFFRLIKGAGGDVVGSLYSVMFNGSVPTQVVLPGMSVRLVNLATQIPSDPVTTDVNGMFVLSRQPPGHYQLCWQAPGFISGCSTQHVAIVDDIVYLAPEPAFLQNNGNSHALFGQVSFLDNSPLHRHDAFYDLDLQTTVRLESLNGTPIASALPNSSGQFILTGVPLVGSGRVVATCETLSAQTDVSLAQTDPANVLLPNHRPEIASVIATFNGQPVKRAAPGATVTLAVAAQDADGDALHYYWVPSLSQGAFTSSDSTNVQWKLPSSAGIHVMYVRVSDNRGGFATARVRVSTASELLFSGVVSDSDGQPVGDATVTLGNAFALTEPGGSFALVVTNDSPPFVLTLSKPGFAPISRVFTDENAGGTYTFFKPEIFSRTVDQDMALVSSQGTEVFIPSNSLTRLDGLPVVNPVTVAITTIDPCNPLFESPVSAIAGGSGAPEGFFSSLTTAHVRVQDASGAELSPLADSAVTLALPVSSGCASNYPTLPKTAGVWSYNLGSGTWTPSGTATFRPSPIGATPVYVLTGVAVPFNNHNAVDPSGPYSTLTLTADRTLALPFDIRVVGGSLAYTRTVYVTPTTLFVPPQTVFNISVLDHRQAPGGYFADPVNPLGVATPDTAKTVNLKVTVASPIAYADLVVPLKLGLQVPLLSTKVEQAEPFLTHGFGVGSAATAASYYAAIDPANQKTTLAAWKTANGFNAGDEASAAYFNASDLGFGRQMHMRRKVGADSNTDTAFYVSNHDTVDHARTGFSVIASVAMDYAYDPAYPSLGRYTKFYVFDASGNRVDRANLDNNGDKFVPNLCIICHGGSHGVSGTASTGWNLNSKFIPFDMESYTYSTAAAYKPAAQHNAFRTMNLAIRDNTSPTPAIQAMVNGWYGISGTGTFDKNYVPTAWQGVSDLPVYRDTVKTSCRACHTTRGLDFSSPSQVGSCGYNVCNILVMPDAQRTFSIMWGSKTANVGGTGTPPNQPDILSTRYGPGLPWVPCP